MSGLNCHIAFQVLDFKGTVAGVNSLQPVNVMKCSRLYAGGHIIRELHLNGVWTRSCCCNDLACAESALVTIASASDKTVVVLRFAWVMFLLEDYITGNQYTTVNRRIRQPEATETAGCSSLTKPWQPRVLTQLVWSCVEHVYGRLLQLYGDLWSRAPICSQTTFPNDGKGQAIDYAQPLPHPLCPPFQPTHTHTHTHTHTNRHKHIAPTCTHTQHTATEAPWGLYWLTCCKKTPGR